MREMREKEMERERLREIAMELKAAQFAALAEVQPPMPLMPMQPMFVPEPPKPEVSQAFLEAVAASQRIAASKNFAEIFNCTNSNDSSSNGPMPIETIAATSNNNSKTHFIFPFISETPNHRQFHVLQTELNARRGNGRSDPAGAAAKMTKHSFRECRLFYLRRWTHISRKHI